MKYEGFILEKDVKQAMWITTQWSENLNFIGKPDIVYRDKKERDHKISQWIIRQ